MDLGGAFRYSTGFGAMEEGLISYFLFRKCFYYFELVFTFSPFCKKNCVLLARIQIQLNEENSIKGLKEFVHPINLL